MTDEKKYTSRQMGHACEMLIAAELTLAGVPTLRVPDLWPGYDLVAQPRGQGAAQRISVKSRTFKRGSAYIGYSSVDTFDWLALVLLPGDIEKKRRVFIIPRRVADVKAKKNAPTTKTANERYWSIVSVPRIFAEYEDNYLLRRK